MSLRNKLSSIAVVYFIEGFPMGVFQKVWPVYFRRHDASLEELGLLSGLALAWSLKLLWSPLVDRYGEKRQWIAGALVFMAASLALLAQLDPHQLNALLWAALIVYCLGSATQDVAIDAYSIGLMDRGEEGPANGMKVAAYRVALVAAGAGLLLLPQQVGWSGTFVAAALLSLVMAAAVFRCPRVDRPSRERVPMWHSLEAWWSRTGAVPVLVFVALYRVGDLSMGPMVAPLWVDRGFSDEEIAFVSTTLGAAATIAGAAVGATYVARAGIASALLALGVLALASNLGYAAAAALPDAGRWPMYGASIVESFCAGLAAAAFLSFLMRICQKEHAAVQYALLTAAYAFVGNLVGMSSGWFTARIDYPAYFALTAIFALPAFALLPAARRWAGEEPRSAHAGAP